MSCNPEKLEAYEQRVALGITGTAGGARGPRGPDPRIPLDENGFRVCDKCGFKTRNIEASNRQHIGSKECKRRQAHFAGIGGKSGATGVEVTCKYGCGHTENNQYNMDQHHVPRCPFGPPPEKKKVSGPLDRENPSIGVWAMNVLCVR